MARDRGGRGDHEQGEQADVAEIIPCGFEGRGGVPRDADGDRMDGHGDAERDDRSAQCEAHQAELAMPRNAAQSGQPGLPCVHADPQKQGCAVNMVQGREVAAPRYQRRVVGQREAEQHGREHDQRRACEIVRPPLVRRCRAVRHAIIPRDRWTAWGGQFRCQRPCPDSPRGIASLRKPANRVRRGAHGHASAG